MEKNIFDFLSFYGYEADKNIEGVIFYGSYQTKTNEINSDIDLIIVYNTESNIKTKKIYANYNNYDFEVYERTIENLYNRVDKDFLNGEDTMLSAIGYGEILKDKNNKLKELQQYTLEKYKNGLPKLSNDDIIYGAKSIHKSIENLNKMNREQSPYYQMFYSLTLDKIRDYYNRKNGFSNMSTSKVYKLYTDNVMQKVQHKFMPEEEFIDMYLKCMEQRNIEDINNLFSYITRDIKDIDYKNIKIIIGGDKNH